MGRKNSGLSGLKRPLRERRLRRPLRAERALPALENLEQRMLLAVIEVTTLNQEVDTDADCSLQEAIFAANFDASEAIDPTNLNGPHIITGATAGSGADTIVLQAGGLYQVSGIVQDQFNIVGLSVNPDMAAVDDHRGPQR